MSRCSPGCGEVGVRLLPPCTSLCSLRAQTISLNSLSCSLGNVGRDGVSSRLGTRAGRVRRQKSRGAGLPGLVPSKCQLWGSSEEAGLEWAGNSYARELAEPQRTKQRAFWYRIKMNGGRGGLGRAGTWARREGWEAGHSGGSFSTDGGPLILMGEILSIAWGPWDRWGTDAGTLSTDGGTLNIDRRILRTDGVQGTVGGILGTDGEILSLDGGTFSTDGDMGHCRETPQRSSQI